MYGIAYALGQAGQGAVEGAIAADERQRGRMVQDRAFTLQENQDKRAQAFSDSFLEDANLRRIDEQVRNEIKASGGDAGGAIPKGNFSLAMAHPDPYGEAPAEGDAPQKFAMTLGEPTATGAKAAPKKGAPAFSGTGGPLPADSGGGQPAAKATKKTLDYAGNADSALERANSNLALARRLDENLDKELAKNPYGSLDQSNPQYQAAIRWAAGKREKLEGARNAAYASALQAKHEADWAQTQGYMRNAALAIRSGDDAAVVKYATPLLGESAKYLQGLVFDKKTNSYKNPTTGALIGANEISAMLSGDQGKIIDAAEKFGDFLVKNKQAEATMAQAGAAHVNPTEQLLQAQYKSDKAQYLRDGMSPAEAEAKAQSDLRFNRSRALPDAKLQTQMGVAQVGAGGRVLQGALSNPAFAGVASDPAFQEMLKQGIIQMVPGAGGQGAAPSPVNGLTPGGARPAFPLTPAPASPAAPPPAAPPSKAPAFPKAVLDGMKQGKVATAPDGSKWTLVNGVPQQINGR